MTDLHARFRTLDRLNAPDLWPEIERDARTSATPDRHAGGTRRMWIAVTAAVVIVLIGGAVLIGSGLIEFPFLPNPVPVPTHDPVPTSQASASPSEPSSAPPSPLEPITGTWTATGPMVATRREYFTATLLPDGSVLVAGGTGAPVTEIFTPESMTWAASGDMLRARFEPAAVLSLDERMVVVTGGSDGLAGGTFNSTEFFDLTTGTWSQHPPLLEARAGHTATVLLDGRILVAGGAGDGTPSSEVFDPDPTVLSWWPTGGPVDDQFDTATLLADGRVLFVGGTQPWIFDIETTSWSAAAPMVRRSAGGHTATRLLDGRVLVAGGGPCCGFSNGAEIYDPDSDSWSATGNMTEARAFFTATLLPDGRVLAAGGGDGGFGGKATTEVFDPQTGTWTAATDMLSARGWHEAVALTDGRVLLVGGYGANEPAGNEPAEPGAEVFDPFGGR